MIMSLKQRKISKIKTKDKIEPQHIHLLESSYIYGGQTKLSPRLEIQAS